jgi:hypothetical protein
MHTVGCQAGQIVTMYIRRGNHPGWSFSVTNSRGVSVVQFKKILSQKTHKYVIANVM